MNEDSGIYKILNTKNGKYYVGSSKHMLTGKNNRKYYHFHFLIKGKHYNEHLQRAWNKYGESSFEFMIIEANILESNLENVEQKYLDIAKMEKDRCYNKSFIAGRIDFTPEVRAKMSINSIKLFGNPLTNPNVGRPCKQSTRDKISKANSGRVMGDEQKQMLSEYRKGKYTGENNSRYGVVLSEETRKKISIASKGRNVAEKMACIILKFIIFITSQLAINFEERYITL